MRYPRIHTPLALLAVLALLAAAAGCVDPVVPVGPDKSDAAQLTLQISLPVSGTLATKADTDPATTGLFGPEGDEAKIHTLQIWAFPNAYPLDTTHAIAYKLLNVDTEYRDKNKDWNNEATIAIPREVITGGLLSLDFFVVANGASVGLSTSSTLTAMPTRGDMKNLTFGDNSTTDYFGSTNIVTAVDDNGLPMSSYVADGFNITFLKYGFTTAQLQYIKTHHGEDFTTNPNNLFSAAQWDYIGTLFSNKKWDYAKVCPEIELTRAVAKVRFIFSKAENMSEQTQIVSVRLLDSSDNDGADDMLPSSMYLFPMVTPTGIVLPVDTYGPVVWGDDDLPMLANGDIKTTDTPYRLLRTSTIQSEYTIGSQNFKKSPSQMTEAQEYENFLTWEVGQGNATEKLMYLRETDKSLKCRIEYKIGPDDDSMQSYDVTVTIPAGQHFYRNNWWTIYAFFMSYKLDVQVVVNDWTGYENNGTHMGKKNQ